MSARDDQMIMLKIMIRENLRQVRACVNAARLRDESLAGQSLADWSQGHISALWMLYQNDHDVPRAIADALYAARVESEWLMSGEYPEPKPSV